MLLLTYSKMYLLIKNMYIKFEICKYFEFKFCNCLSIIIWLNFIIILKKLISTLKFYIYFNI